MAEEEEPSLLLDDVRLLDLLLRHRLAALPLHLATLSPRLRLLLRLPLHERLLLRRGEVGEVHLLATHARDDLLLPAGSLDDHPTAVAAPLHLLLLHHHHLLLLLLLLLLLHLLGELLLLRGGELLLLPPGLLIRTPGLLHLHLLLLLHHHHLMLLLLLLLLLGAHAAAHERGAVSRRAAKHGSPVSHHHVPRPAPVPHHHRLANHLVRATTLLLDLLHAGLHTCPGPP